ncbi:MAG: hypothetical protein JXO22_03350 [Phycisphaerae bacterium]|nr:hypothetical protein [Phycisphaerae bacterium]
MQRNVVLGGIGVVALLIAAYLTFSGVGRTKEVPTTYESYGVCLACKADARFSHDADEDAPYDCKNCGERAVYPWLYCFDCEKRFVPTLVADADGPPKMPGFPRCPVCRQSHFAAYDPEDPDQKNSKGDAPLPKWNP